MPYKFLNRNYTENNVKIWGVESYGSINTGSLEMRLGTGLKRDFINIDMCIFDVFDIYFIRPVVS